MVSSFNWHLLTGTELEVRRQVGNDLVMGTHQCVGHFLYA